MGVPPEGTPDPMQSHGHAADPGTRKTRDQLFAEIACFLLEGERGELLRFAPSGAGEER